MSPCNYFLSDPKKYTDDAPTLRAASDTFLRRLDTYYALPPEAAS